MYMLKDKSSREDLTSPRFNLGINFLKQNQNADFKSFRDYLCIDLIFVKIDFCVCAPL